MIFPVPVSRFESYVPHRPPMVWIDEVLSVSKEGGECRIHLKETALYMKDGQIRPTAFIEWIAQGFAYVRAAQLEMAGIPNRHSKAFLVGVRDAEFISDLNVGPPSSLRVFVHQFREVGPVVMFDGEVRTDENKILMRANVRVYQA